MTVVDMHHVFLLKAKVLDRTDIKNTLSYDISTLLNNAQQSIIDELIANKQWDLLRPLIESLSITGAAFDSYVSGINSDGEGNCITVRTVKLSTLSTTVMTFRNYVRSQSKITRTKTPEVIAETLVQNEEISKNLIGDFEINGSNYPIFTNPKCFLEGDYLVVMGDYYTNIGTVAVIVVRHPKTMDLITADSTRVTTCELPAHLHDAVVDRAVQIFGETVNINDVKQKGQ